MLHYFCIAGNFVHSGNVNKGMPSDSQDKLGSFADWPLYEAPADTNDSDENGWLNMALDTPASSVEQEPLDQYCSFWDKTGYELKIFGETLKRFLKERLKELA